MKLADLVIDWEQSLGNSRTGMNCLMAVDIREAYDYVDGKKNKVIGWTVDTVVPKHKFDKVQIKIVGLKVKPFEIPEEDGSVYVYFHNLRGKCYFDYTTNQVKFSIIADDVEVLPVD